MSTLILKGLNFKDLLTAVLILTATVFLVLFSIYASDIVLSERLPSALNKQLFYQPITLVLTLLLLSFLAFMYKDTFVQYFKVGKINAHILPAPQVGINPKPSDTWMNVGFNFLVVISLVTAGVIYFQSPTEGSISVKAFMLNLPTVVLFALCNAFVEESITRFAPIVLLKDKIADNHIAIISAFLFGFAHYWGSPGGVTGILVASFLGWLLAKSIIETKGIFWAFLIHFVQDVIILSALFAQDI